MKMPCELIVWYVLPSIRRDLAIKLKEKGMAQKDIAEKLGVTAAAVSQYVKSRRGSSEIQSREMERQIDALANEIAKGEKADLRARICGVCGVCKRTSAMEQLYSKYGDK